MLRTRGSRGIIGFCFCLLGLAAFTVAGFYWNVIAGFVMVGLSLFYLETRVSRGEEP
jgi:hypothetical protein